MFFDVTDVEIEKAILRIAKDPKGPAAGWSKGECVTWRPLTDLLPPEQAKALVGELQSKEPPNNFRVIPTAGVDSE